MKSGQVHPALAMVALALAAGCASHPNPQPAMGQASPKPIPTTPGFDARDPVATSEVREHALSVIEEGALSPDAQVRANSVEAAALAPDRLKSVIDHGLDDRNAGVRCVAAMAVGKARLAKLASRVRPLLTDQSSFVRSAAIFALVRCDAEVDRTPLAGMILRDPSLRVRSHVAYILGEIGDVSALPLLRECIRERTPGTNPEQFKLFELQVAEAMVKLGDRDQCGVIQAALHPSHPEGMEAIALAAQLIGEVQDGTAGAQLVSLADYREHVDSKGVTTVGSKKIRTYPPEVRLAAAAALSALGIKGTAATMIADEYSVNDSAPIRAQAAYVYGQVGGTDNWGKLNAMMGDADGAVRIAAAAAVLRSPARSSQG
jgi:HEAT repeat protein